MDVKALQDEILLKDKEIALLIAHCESLTNPIKSLKLLDELNNVIEENKRLNDLLTLKQSEIESLNDHTLILNDQIMIKAEKNKKLHEQLNIKEEMISCLEHNNNKKDNLIQEQDDLIRERYNDINKLNDELIDLNFVLYNKNQEIDQMTEAYKEKEVFENPLYIDESSIEKDQLKLQLQDKQTMIDEQAKQIEHYATLIDNIKKFIASQQCVPLFNPGKMIEHLLAFFHEKTYDIPLLSPDLSPILKPCSPKTATRLRTRKMAESIIDNHKKKINNRS